jgi:hypothetical protein
VIAKRGFRYRLWPSDSSEADADFPSRDDFIAYLALFRQFFLHSGEPIEVHRVASAFRQRVHDQELLRQLDGVERILDAPFGSSLCLTVSDRTFSPRELMEAWISRYLHSDRLPPELMNITGSEWQFCITPLTQYFYVGIQVLDRLGSLIAEAKNRGLLQPDLSSNGPVA